jgi:hypothetical protein
VELDVAPGAGDGEVRQHFAQALDGLPRLLQAPEQAEARRPVTARPLRFLAGPAGTCRSTPRRRRTRR